MGRSKHPSDKPLSNKNFEWIFEHNHSQYRLTVDLTTQIVHLYWTVSPDHLAQFEPPAGVITWTFDEYCSSSDTRLGILDKPVRKQVLHFIRGKSRS